MKELCQALLKAGKVFVVARGTAIIPGVRVRFIDMLVIIALHEHILVYMRSSYHKISLMKLGTLSSFINAFCDLDLIVQH